MSGLVCLELLKIAGERCRQRGLKNIGLSAKAEKERILELFRNSFANLALPMLAASQPVEAESFSVSVKKQSTKQHFAAGLISKLKNLGKKFDREQTSNSQIDEAFEVATFTAWDTIKIPGTIENLRISDIADFLSEKFLANVQSVSWGDVPIFADYFDDTEKRYSEPLDILLKRSLIDDSNELQSDDGFLDDRASDVGSGKVVAERMWKLCRQRGFVDLEVNTSI